MALVTYIDKDESQVAPDPRKMVTDDDMNELKNVINTNADVSFISSFFAFNVVPTGTVNGSNTAFTLPETPIKLALFADGLAMTPTVDYSITGPNITFVVAPESGVLAHYIKTP